MGGSIHIHGTSSSILDTVFVCRDTGQTQREWLFESGEELALIVNRDLAQLTETGRKPTAGDTRCMIFGHLTRMAIWNLRKKWDAAQPTNIKLVQFAQTVLRLADPDELLRHLMADPAPRVPPGRLFLQAAKSHRIRDAVVF